MIPHSQIASGFDAEILIGENFIKHLLATLIDVGELPLTVDLDDPMATGTLSLHPPTGFARDYEPHIPSGFPEPMDGSFDTTLLFDDPNGANLRVNVHISGTITVVLIPGQPPIPITIDESRPHEMFLRLSLHLTYDENDTEEAEPIGVAFSLDLVDVAGELVLPATRPIIMAMLAPLINRNESVPFPGRDKILQQLELRLLPGRDDHPPALGLYINLFLKKGPGNANYLEKRGRADDGINFLPEGQDYALGLPAELYGRVRKHLFESFGKSIGAIGSSYYLDHHPEIPKSDMVEKVRVNRVEFGPEVIKVPREDERGKDKIDGLRITIHTEVQLLGGLYEPDLKVILEVYPKVEDGILSFGFQYDIKLGLLADYFLVYFLAVVGLALVLVLGPAGAIVPLAIAGLGLAAGEIVEGVAMEKITEEADFASIFDLLVPAIPVTTKRWDPFYETIHQVMALVSHLSIAESGMSIAGTAQMRRQNIPIGHAVIQGRTHKEGGALDELYYRIKDFEAFENMVDLEAMAAWRTPFQRPERADRPDWYALKVYQAGERVHSDRLVKRIPYEVLQVDVRSNQIRFMKTLSLTEQSELEREVVKPEKEKHEEAIRQSQGDILEARARATLVAQGNSDPSRRDIRDWVNEEVSRLADEQIRTFREQVFRDHALLEMSPHEYGTLDRDYILGIRRFDLITMKRNDRISHYYRDRADRSTSDNLMSMPPYRSDLPLPKRP